MYVSDPQLHTSVFARTLALWAGPLAHVQFPGAAGEVLDAAAFTRWHADLIAAEEAVAAADHELTLKRNAELQLRTELRGRAERMLAYARVFAEGDAEVTAAVQRAAESLGIGQRKDGPTRGRPRGSARDQQPLLSSFDTHANRGARAIATDSSVAAHEDANVIEEGRDDEGGSDEEEGGARRGRRRAGPRLTTRHVPEVDQGASSSAGAA